MTPMPQRFDRSESVVDRVVSILIDSTRRTYAFTILAYITGMLGIATVFAQELWLSVPDEVAVPASILLMGVSFVSLFLAALSAPVAVEG